MVAPRSTQPFILPRSIKWVPGIFGNVLVKSKLPPSSSAVALRQLNTIHKKRGHKVLHFPFFCHLVPFSKNIHFLDYLVQRGLLLLIYPQVATFRGQWTDLWMDFVLTLFTIWTWFLSNLPRPFCDSFRLAADKVFKSAYSLSVQNLLW